MMHDQRIVGFNMIYKLIYTEMAVIIHISQVLNPFERGTEYAGDAEISWLVQLGCILYGNQ